MFVEDTLILAYWDPAVRRPSSVRRRQSQVASLAAKVRAMYSASVEDSGTVACCLERQLTGPPFSMNINPEVDLLLVLSPAQSESE